MSPMIIQCPFCGSLKEAGQPCATCKEQAKKADEKERRRLEYERKQNGQQKHGHSEDR